jgi:hypothetical protein
MLITVISNIILYYNNLNLLAVGLRLLVVLFIVPRDRPIYIIVLEGKVGIRYLSRPLPLTATNSSG